MLEQKRLTLLGLLPMLLKTLVNIMQVLLGTQDYETLVKQFGDRVSCLHRFKQNIQQVPNIYFLVNVTDNLSRINCKFY